MARHLAVVKLAVTALVAVVSLSSTSVAFAASTDERSHALVDEARVKGGRNALPINAKLDAVAHAHNQRMIERTDVYHNPELGSEVTAAGVTWGWVAENVGAGPDVQRVHSEFMASHDHHTMLMHPSANAIGVATGVGRDGKVYVTHVYADVRQAAKQPPPPVARPAPPPPRPSTPALAPVKVIEPAPEPPPVPNALVGGVVAIRPVPTVATAGIGVHPPVYLFVGAIAAAAVAMAAGYADRRSRIALRVRTALRVRAAEAAAGS